MCATAVRRVSTRAWPAAGTCSETTPSFCRHCSATCAWALATSSALGAQPPVCGNTTATSRLWPGSSLIVYISAPDAMPVLSFTAVVAGYLPLARCSASSLPSNVLAKRASGTCSG
ncbi:hypothetical protein G6F50_017042 [Rhizopus delemar]|uniref:Uncharacterized protein n=1 Tax=Rhizopus delemar TaxID=936053 RepID=A0A9P6XR47_9FUNG|nr:hypothetical protein G6F50_017042 [Rhizopus delemar]